MKKAIVCALASLMLNVCFADKADDAIYMRIAGDAEKEIQNGNYTKAESLLLQAMRMQPGNPTNVMLLSNLGMVHFYMGKDSIALQNLDDAHRMAPASVTILMNRAKVKSAIGMTDDAIEDYNNVCKLDSTASQTYFLRGMIRMSQHKPEEAYPDFVKLQQISPDDIDTALALGTYYLEINRPSEAIPYFTKLLKKEKTPEYYSTRALCYIMTDQLSEAADDIAAGLELAPDDGELYFCRALLNKKRFRPADSVSDARRALELGINPKRLDGLIN